MTSRVFVLSISKQPSPPRPKDPARKGAAPTTPAMMYFTTVAADPQSPGFRGADGGGVVTPTQALKEVRAKLGKLKPVAGDTFRYKEKSYSTVDQAIAAMEADKPSWV